MTGERGVVEPFEDVSLGPPAVRGFLHRPVAPSGAALVLTHGAGGNCRVPLLVALASAFAARGITALRCDLPYRQARPTGPPAPGKAALDRQGLAHAVLALRRMTPGTVCLGGHSYGGRQASLLVAAEPNLAGALLLLSYPLHSPGRAEFRTAHFPELRAPTFFAHGSADPFGSLAEMEAARALIPATTGLLALDGARHDLYEGRPGPDAAQRVADRVATEFLAWRACPGH
jgi:predicted alpha/beta-hydrolase family hydrolase